MTPRRLTEALLEPLLMGGGLIEDVVIVRVHCIGRSNGRTVRAEVDTMIYHAPETGLTAMQRCTGFDAAVVAAMTASKALTPGVAVRELLVDPERYVAELDRRGMEVCRSVTELDDRANRPVHRGGQRGQRRR